MTVSAGVIPHGYCIARIKGRLEATGILFRGHRPRHLLQILSVAGHGYGRIRLQILLLLTVNQVHFMC